MTRIDLDQKRREREAARQEKDPTGEGHIVVFRGREFHLPDEPSYELAEAAAEGRITSAVRNLLDPAEAEEFFGGTPRPSVYDVQDLAQAVAEVYGFVSPGESQASQSSSTSTSKQSRPSSPITTP